VFEAFFSAAQFPHSNFLLLAQSLDISLRRRAESKTTDRHNSVGLIHALKAIWIVLRNFWLLRSHPSLYWRGMLVVCYRTGIHMLYILYFYLLQLLVLLLHANGRMSYVSVSLNLILVLNGLLFFENTASCYESLYFFKLSFLLASCFTYKLVLVLIFDF
jgi:hypothetical protein